MSKREQSGSTIGIIPGEVVENPLQMLAGRTFSLIYIPTSLLELSPRNISVIDQVMARHPDEDILIHIQRQPFDLPPLAKKPAAD